MYVFLNLKKKKILKYEIMDEIAAIIFFCGIIIIVPQIFGNRKNFAGLEKNQLSEINILFGTIK